MINKISARNISLVLFLILSFAVNSTPGHTVTSDRQFYTEVAANTSDSRLAGPRVFRGQRIAVSINGSKPFAVKKVSRGVFADKKSYAAGRFALLVDVEALGYLKPQLSSFFAGRDQKISGEIYLLSRNENVKEIVEFFDAHISSITMPAFDASGDGTTEHYFTVKFAEGRIEPIATNKLKQTVKPVSKKWQNFNFKFELGSLPCERVTKIDSFTVRQRASGSRPAQLEFPNLTIHIPADDGPAWQDWQRSFVIEGKCSPLEGKITLLGSDGRKKLAVFRLSNVCPVSVKKHLAIIKYEDITVDIGMGMSR